MTERDSENEKYRLTIIALIDVFGVKTSDELFAAASKLKAEVDGGIYVLCNQGMTDPKESGKEEKWKFQGLELSAVFRHKGAPEDGYMYVYQLHSRIGDKDYGHLYNPDKFTFDEAREHFEKIIMEQLERERND